MLEIKAKLIDDKMYFIRFCLSQDQVNEIINENEEETGIKFYDREEGDEEFILEDFEEYIFSKALAEHDIKTMGPLRLRYQTDLNYSTPLIGICKGVKYDDSFDVDYPVELSNKVNQRIDGKQKECENFFELALLKRGLYFEKADTQIKKFAKIDYELRYVENDIVIDVIKNQKFDMLEDDDIDGSILIGAKIGDLVILKDDKIKIGALIQNITNRIPFSENSYDKDVMYPIYKSLKTRSFQDFRNKYYEIYKKKCARDIYFKTIIDEMASRVRYEVSDEVVKLFDELNDLPFRSSYEDCSTILEKKVEIKKKLLYYYLVLKNDLEYTDMYNAIDTNEELTFLSINDSVSMSEVNFEINKMALLDILKDKIKNINKEYK